MMMVDVANRLPVKQRRRLAVALAGMSALTLGSNYSAHAVSCSPSRWLSPRTLIIAHASGDHFGPPNTIEMMRAALRAGADMLDVDVRRTKDDVFVASHDDQLTDGTISLSIAKSTYAELRKLDLRGTWEQPRGVAAIKNPVRIPTVESILRAFPTRKTSLEFKVAGSEAKLCEILRQTKRTDNVYVGSAGDAAVDAFAPLCPEVTTTVTDAMVPLMRQARQSGSDWCAPVSIGQPPLNAIDDATDVRWNHEHGLAVFTWTADDRATLKRVAELGVDAVYTARPDLAKVILRR
jgi:glycerophosphoryl diester phosphodiesterase